MKTFLCCMALAVLLSGCKQFRPSPRGALTVEQARYLAKYTYLRKRATDALGLPADATAEEIRLCAAESLQYGADAPWEQILEARLLRFWCTPERLEKFRKIFALPEGTTWPVLGLYIETLRLRMSAQ